MKRRVRERALSYLRQDSAPDVLGDCQRQNLSLMERWARRTRRQCEAERVVIDPEERIVFTRTIPTIPPVYDETDWNGFFGARKPNQLRLVANICADWEMLLSQGLLGRKKAALQARDTLSDHPEAIQFLDCAIDSIEVVIELAQRYAVEARRMGKEDVAAILDRVPAHPARTFHEALQSIRICHSVLWLSGHWHMCLGRFDQYMWPYLSSDLGSGRLSEEEAEELIAEFFIALNKDTDLYHGVQQGDNGQSIMLGGIKRDGSDAVNPLTRMVLHVANDVCMIDPKINLRVNSLTEPQLLELAAELTRKGLGFPQYSNDEVVIPALVSHGYDLEDARDYTVAACWEFIIPGKGMEIVNIGAVSFPEAANRGIIEGLSNGGDFEEIKGIAERSIREQVSNLVDIKSKVLILPAPFYSVFMNDCLETGKDISRHAKYGNFGIHGAGSSNAADALAAVKKFIFEEKSIKPVELIEALEADFAGYESIRKDLIDEGPKVGNNDGAADGVLVFLFDAFAEACENTRDNGRIIRPGTGTAMYYVWLARGHEDLIEPVVGATADGRKKGDFFASSLAPSPGVRVRGPVSVLQSFSKIDYSRVYNGGPITIELSDTVFSDDESLHKVALFIQSFAKLGCQQLQLNTLNSETLEDAKLHPERHKNLVVRVWGWSGYFCELDPEYQDHIIARNKFLV